jgi:hypothetical protein
MMPVWVAVLILVPVAAAFTVSAVIVAEHYVRVHVGRHERAVMHGPLRFRFPNVFRLGG